MFWLLFRSGVTADLDPPRGFGPPGPDPLADLDKSASGYGPPLADLDPLENKRSIE